jgi:hypothetical protein
MAIPALNAHTRPLVKTVAGVLLGAMLASCATSPLPRAAAVALDRPPVQFSQGRMSVILLDEYGIAMPGMRVDLSWEEPSFHKTSAFTNSSGEVSFWGVPQVAEVTIDHPGGIYQSTVLVPQSGMRPQLRVMVDTLGEGQLMRERERQLFAPAPRQAAAE